MDHETYKIKSKGSLQSRENREPKNSITDLTEMLETAREKSTCLEIKLLVGKKIAEEMEIREKKIDMKDQEK